MRTAQRRLKKFAPGILTLENTPPNKLPSTLTDDRVQAMVEAGPGRS